MSIRPMPHYSRVAIPSSISHRHRRSALHRFALPEPSSARTQHSANSPSPLVCHTQFCTPQPPVSHSPPVMCGCAPFAVWHDRQADSCDFWWIYFAFQGVLEFVAGGRRCIGQKKCAVCAMACVSVCVDSRRATVCNHHPPSCFRYTRPYCSVGLDCGGQQQWLHGCRLMALLVLCVVGPPSRLLHAFLIWPLGSLPKCLGVLGWVVDILPWRPIG
ncbi:hypothetical protein BCR44DRAFT_1036718 [Catenaria anguillulae PL171]|uniref:Uncharacterized protein n=1 Tax=Catenaria anguillulae PL171 TaxID=765915 RepID=A0A1Y2HSQ8_9FUNG|nr:hypothetical protein BCR44DRAFT_1036718 [Catenaria anguillulae PL171]